MRAAAPPFDAPHGVHTEASCPAVTRERWAGGVYKLELFLPDEYPMSAPKVLRGCNVRTRCVAGAVADAARLCVAAFQVRFLTKIYHPNIDKARGAWRRRARVRAPPIR